jgi:hypothetical protein
VQVVLTLSFDQGAVATEARVAEDAGYDGIATGEHLFFHVPHANSFVALAAAGGNQSHPVAQLTHHPSAVSRRHGRETGHHS